MGSMHFLVICAVAALAAAGADPAEDLVLGATWPAACLGSGLGESAGAGAGQKCWIFHQRWRVFPWNPLRHSWLRFAGRVFEFIGDSRDSSVLVHEKPFASDRCATGVVRRLGAAPTASGLACALGCALGYKQFAGNYSLLCNNCHNFVNSLADALLAVSGGGGDSGCPGWCRRPFAGTPATA